jgi:hypothetical protein
MFPHCSVVSIYQFLTLWMNGPVTIASVRAHGVRQSPVYCLGKREGDWPCHHSGKLAIDRFQSEEVLSERRCRCTVCGWRRVDLRPDYSKQQAARRQHRLDDAAIGRVSSVRHAELYPNFFNCCSAVIERRGG